MNYLIEFIKSQFEIEPLSAKYKLQLQKVNELENKFTKGISKNKWKEYFDLEIEKGQLHSIEIDHIIKITFQICKELFS